MRVESPDSFIARESRLSAIDPSRNVMETPWTAPDEQAHREVSDA